MKINRIGVLAALVAAGLLLLPARAQEPAQSGVRDTTSARMLVTRVRVEPEKWAKPGECADLGPESFKVQVHGKWIKDPKAIDVDRRHQPTVHALLLDTSGSMSGDLAYVQYAATEYVGQLREGFEKALVASFDDSVVLLQGVTGNKKQLVRAIEGLRMGAETSLLDGMYYVMRELDSHRERPVMVLLSDGADNASFYDMADVIGQAEKRRDLTIFTIGVGLRSARGEKPTKEFLRKLAASSGGKFFDVAEGASLRKVFTEIRDLLEAEAVIGVVDPRPSGKPGKMVVESAVDACSVKVVRQRDDDEPVAPDPSRTPIGRPVPELPQSYSTPLTAAHLRLYDDATERSVDPACSAGGFFNATLSDSRQDPLWFFHVGRGGTTGCGLDVTLEPGALYSPDAEEFMTTQRELHLRARPYEIDIPHRMSELSRGPEGAMDALAAHALSLTEKRPDAELWREPVELHARPFVDYPMLVHGMTFLEMREVMAVSAFFYPEYREWVLGRLSRNANREIKALSDTLHRRAPHLPADALEAAVRVSADGLAILDRAEHPSPVDLMPYLSAWLGDLTAYELFLRWENDRIDALLAGEHPKPAGPLFYDSWNELRRVFVTPSYARILTLLNPIFDPVCDCVGYWRIELPRPSWFAPRMHYDPELEGAVPAVLDLVAELPLGHWAYEQMALQRPELAEYLATGEFRADYLHYEPTTLPAEQTPIDTYRRSRVHLVLASPDGTRRFQISSEISLSGEPGQRRTPVLEGSTLVSEGDAELERLIALDPSLAP